jgi:hypothetical protein
MHHACSCKFKPEDLKDLTLINILNILNPEIGGPFLVNQAKILA